MIGSRPRQAGVSARGANALASTPRGAPNTGGHRRILRTPTRVAASSSDTAGSAADAHDEALRSLKAEKLKRAGKYKAKVAGTDTPEWIRARVVGRKDVMPDVREFTLEGETSRELVSLRNSYCAIGKRLQMKIRGGEPISLAPSSPPFPIRNQHAALLRLRGDLSAGQTKLPEDPISVKELITVLVPKPRAGDADRDALDEAYALDIESEGTSPEALQLEVGPFLGDGMDLRGPIQSVFSYPTLLLFAEGCEGIATAKAIVEGCMDRGGLDFRFREEVRLFYKVPNEDSVCYADLFDFWKEEYGVTTVVSEGPPPLPPLPPLHPTPGHPSNPFPF